MYYLKEMVGPVFYKGNMGPVCRLLSYVKLKRH